MSVIPPPRPDLGPLALPPLPADGPSQRPVAPWRWWEVLLVYLGCFAVSSFLASLIYLAADIHEVGGPAGGVDLAVSLVAALMSTGLLLLWLRARHPIWRSVVGWPSWRDVPKELAIGGALGLLVLVAAGITSNVVTGLLRETLSRPVARPEQVTSDLSAAGIAVFAVYAVIVAPATEELFFRGLLFRSIRDRHGLAVGAIGSAIPFGLVHVVLGQPWPNVLALQLTMVVTGVGLALIYEWRGNLLANMAGHAAFNLVAVIAYIATATR
jgi:membrane protease YdiL (CAAX protease family)